MGGSFRYAALGVGLGLVVAGCAGQDSMRRPAPRVQRLLPVVVRWLEVTNGGGSRKTADGWTWFCAVRYLGNSSIEDRFDLYLWEACQEYRLRGRRLVTFTGSSVPAVVTLVKRKGRYVPVAEREPGDGDQYSPDVRRMFPKSAQKVIWTINVETGPGTTSAIFAALDRRARRELSRTG